MNFFKRNRCEKLIQYESRKISARGEVSGFFIGDFETQVRLNLIPSKLAKTLDDYQYLKCKDAENCEKNDPKKKEYLDKRDIAIDLLTSLRAAIESSGHDARSLKKNISTSLKNVQNFLQWNYEKKMLERKFRKIQLEKKLKKDLRRGSRLG
ncbi:MAG: hypothetical protein OEM77_04725 [Nitrosopumilus sp.]|nr:hypothetical protein [Nitrosopumilus sp.]MDH3736445.1 hypothetical protein [Nitrosopumilus sp.]MDH3823895.1 hypothetical protein [Nitrosopumilus sp.]MDH3832995.1 hypothetical protein [Nitrosopumilus sp.]